LRPLLKWAGGKRTQVKKIIGLFPRDHKERRYHEPFFGGGAVFFHIEPFGGTINDINPRLMNFYRVVQTRPKELIEEAAQYRYNKEEYYRLRTRFNSGRSDEVEEAALLLYLNKTAYNGLYRVNSKGKFNVPFGRYEKPTIVQERRILCASQLLKKVEILSEDFTYIGGTAEEGDICYLDPPYNPVSDTANFTGYAVGGFDADDQDRLKDLCVELNKRGTIFVLSNSDTEFVRQLYEGVKDLRLIPLSTNRMISSKVSSRSSGHDLLITNNLGSN
jgi:DNA adenine methylase